MERNQVFRLVNQDGRQGSCPADWLVGMLFRCGESCTQLTEVEGMEFTAGEAAAIADRLGENKENMRVPGRIVDRAIRVFRRGPVTAALVALGGPAAHLDDRQIDEIMRDPDVWQ